MIVITGTARLSDAPDAREQIIPIVETMLAAAQGEAGCHGIRYSFDVSDPQLMVFHEMYETMEALQAHMQAPHMATFYEAGGALMAGRPDLTMWVNAEKGSMGR
jgi:quinol monooxygenase YgiN